MIVLLAVAVTVTLVRQKQLPWIKGVYGPPTGLPPHPIAESEVFLLSVQPSEAEENPYMIVTADVCCLEVMYNHDPRIDVWFRQTGDWVQPIEAMWIQPNDWYTICLTDYQESRGYNPTESAEVAIITLSGGGAPQYRNDVIVPACETLPTEPPTEPTATPTATPTEPPAEPTATPGPEPAGCGEPCSYNSDCEGDLVCRDVEGAVKCVNEDCPFDDDCVCAAEPTPGRGAPEPTPTITPTPTPLPKVERPQELPPTASLQRTILGLMGGVILILVGLAF